MNHPRRRTIGRPRCRRLLLATLATSLVTMGLGFVTATPAQAVPTAGLTGRWTFDEGTGPTSGDAAGGHTATLQGGAGWAAGVQGPSALAVNGTTAVADTGAAVIDTTKSFSVSSWVKLNNVNGFQTVVSQDGNQVSNFFLGLRGDTGKFAFVRLPSDAGQGAPAFPSSSISPVAGQWYQLTGVYDSVRKTLALYVNGGLAATTAAPTAWAAGGDLVVGRGKYGGAPVDFVNGTIDDVHTFNVALTPSDVAELAASGLWRLDEGAGTVAHDDSPNGDNGTLNGGASWTKGVVGTSAVQFDGASGAVDVAQPVVDTSKSFTVSAWARVDAADGFRTFASVDGANVSGFFLQRRGDGRWAFTRLASDSTAAAASTAESTATATVGSWTQLVGVYDAAANTITLYVNGQRQSTVAYTGGWQATGSFVLGRGQFGGPGDWFAGAVDDVRVLPYAVDAATAQNLATSGLWHFDEGSGNTTADAGPAADTGTLRGATWTTGVANSGLAFNGNADVNMGNAAALDLDTGSATVSAWFRTTSTAIQPIAGKGLAAAADNGYRIGTSGGAVTARLGGGANRLDITTAARTFADGNWHDAALVVDRAAHRATLYVDGSAQTITAAAGSCGIVTGAALDITACTAATASAAADFTVGSTAGGTPRFTGAIDEVSVQRAALSAAQIAVAAGAGTLNVNASDQRTSTHSTEYGGILEDISHSVEGGVYAELVRNRSFNGDYQGGSGAGNGPVPYWNLTTRGGAAGAFAVDSRTALNTALSESLKVTTTVFPGGSEVDVNNVGFYGIKVSPSTTYTGSLWAKADAGFQGKMVVSLRKTNGAVITSRTLSVPTTGWKQYPYTLQTSAAVGTSTDNYVTVAFVSNCSTALCARLAARRSAWLSTVSLFPPTYKNRKNGLRVDLMTELANMHLGLLRVPGGNALEGNTFDTRFQWEKTIGPIQNRPGHEDTAWGYWSTDGMGILEYLQMAEDIGAQPLLAVNAGYALNGTHIPEDQYGAYVQSALNEIQYAIGGPTTTWGARRVADGHPAPFKLTYVEIGNEDFFDSSGSYEWRFADMYDAIKAAYPQLQLIATTPVASRTPDIIDEHYYASPQSFVDMATKYDTYNRSGPRILVGEYGAQEGSPTGDLNSAVGEAAFLTGIERNSDIVMGGMYAPMFVNENQSNWPTNLIGLNAATSYGSPSYWVQTMFANNTGQKVLGSQLSAGSPIKQVVTGTFTSGSSTVYVKLVNPTSSLQSVKLTLANMPVASSYVQTILTGAPADRNTLADPDNVVPVTTTRTGLTNGSRIVVPANSVLTLKITGGGGVQPFVAKPTT